MFTPSHVASVLTDLVNSSDRTVCETLELLHGDPIGHTIADGRTLVTEEQTRHLLTRMGITVTRPFLHRCFGGVSSVLRKMATCDWCSSPFE